MNANEPSVTGCSVGRSDGMCVCVCVCYPGDGWVEEPGTEGRIN